MRMILALACMTAPLTAWSVPLQHTVVKGDTLWALAGTYYKNNFRWKVIYSANQQKIKDPHWIYPGQVFDIADVPGPEIGEVPARPIETAAAVKAPEPAAEPAPAPEQELLAKAPPAAPPKVEEEVRQPLTEAARGDDVSSKMPEQIAGQWPSMTRVMPPKGWSADGEVVEFDGHEILATQGETINGKLSKGQTAATGDRFWVYRKDAPQYTDADQKAKYLQTVGEVEVVKAAGPSSYTFVVRKCGDSLQLGDLLKREEK